jgi:hypothetical protein
VRWRVLLSEFQYQVEHIPGRCNLVADGLTRVSRVEYEKIKPAGRYLYRDDTISRIFRLEGEEVESLYEGVIDDVGTKLSKQDMLDEDNPTCSSDRFAIFAKFHNSMVGHLGVERTLQAMSKCGHGWAGMRQEVTAWISECGICQKIKWQRPVNWEDEAIHHLYSVNPLEELSVDTLGPLPEDEFGNRYVVVILDNFSKFIGLYSATSTSTRDFVSALLKWIGIFGLPKKIRSDGGSQFTSNLAQELRIVLGFDHLVVIPYHPQANSLVERRMKEIMIHLRALVYEKRIKSEWSHFLPLVQRILNYSVDGSIGTQPARVLFGEIAFSDIAMDLPSEWANRDSLEFLSKLREAHSTLIRVTQDYLKKNQRKRSVNGRAKASEVTKFSIGDFVLLSYPSRPPNKLAGLYRGPMIITSIDRPDIIQVRDLITNKLSMVHTSRLRAFRHPKEMTTEEAAALAATDLDEFHVESIVDHEGEGKDPKKWKFRVRWLGYEPEDDTWLKWSAVKDLEALDTYSQANPHLNLG